MGGSSVFPHATRRSPEPGIVATHMVRNGARLKDVADVLGHRSLKSTQIYVKVDEPSLREVALPWPGGDV